MANRDITYYLHKLTHLKRDNKYSGAPHKPIMILSLISNIEIGYIKSDKI